MRLATRLAFTLLLLFCSACSSGDKQAMWNKLDQMATKPAATEPASAKAIYDEASKFVAWLEFHPEDSTPEMLEQARALRNRRMEEGGKLVGEKVVGGLVKVLDDIFGEAKTDDGKRKPSASVGETLGKAADKILGVNDPRLKTFGCPDKNEDETPFDITKEGASKLCP